MKVKALTIFIFITILIGGLFRIALVRADELEDISKQIEQLEIAKQQSENATKPLEIEANQIQGRLNAIQASMNRAAENIQNLEKSIVKREKDFSYQYEILSIRAEQLYKHLRIPRELLTFFNHNSLGSIVRELGYQRAVTQEDKNVIIKISQELSELEKDKHKVEQDKKTLENLQTRLKPQLDFFQKEIEGAKKYQAALKSQIAQLSAKQQQLIAAKQSSLNLPTSLGAGPLYCTDDRQIDPGFSPAFAFFTFGIPHRVGLNQYGALGRAKDGQKYQDILRAYFDNINFEKRENKNIKVQGFGEMPLETYLLGIYEMPGDWPIEALKAQVVAARSYVLAYTNNGEKEICTTQSCQVYKGGNKGGSWEQAVKETEGEVMLNNGQVITAWYASTAGAYTFKSSDVGWSDRSWTKRLRDTNGEISSFGDIFNKAYDKDSPCLYAAQGWRAEYGKSAWLKSGELADIVNVILLAQKDASTQTHLSQLDKPNPDGEETWDSERVKKELQSRGEKSFNNISSVSVSADFNIGKSSQIRFEGDRSGVSFSADEFRNYFNLRAPANIQIVGPLFNVEKK